MGPRRAKKRLIEEPETGNEQKRRRKALGFTPFKQVEIPASWKFELEKLREAVRTSVAHCHYDDASKRERLGNAVLEALSGQKTMKAAATAHGVPFTTLQTYFHRSRARMAKMMNDSDNALPEQIQIPVSLSLSPCGTGNALAEERAIPAGLSRSSRLNTLLDTLSDRVEKGSLSDNAKSQLPGVTTRKTGSNKRKPKEVHRIAPVSPVKHILEDENESLNSFEDQSQSILFPNFMELSHGDNEITDAKTSDVAGSSQKWDALRITKYKKNELSDAIKYVLSDAYLDDDNKISMKWIIGEIFDKSLNVTDFCSLLKLEPTFIQSCVDRVEKFLKRADGLSHSSEKKAGKKAEWENDVIDTSLPKYCIESMDKSDSCTTDICLSRHRSLSEKQVARKASTLIIGEDHTASWASNATQLPTSTVYPRVHRAQAALETLSPSEGTALFCDSNPAKGEIGGRNAGRSLVHSNSISKEMEEVIGMLVKVSSYDDAGQQKLHDAILEVLTKDAPVAEVSKQYDIPAIALQPYVNKARTALGQSLYPTTSGFQTRKIALDAELITSEEHGSTANEVSTSNGTSRVKSLPTDVVLAACSTGVETNMEKVRSKRGRRCKTINLSDDSSMNKMDNSVDLDGVLGNNGHSNNEFDYHQINFHQSNVAKVCPRRGKRMGSLGNEEQVDVTKSSTNSPVLTVEHGSRTEISDDFYGLPRSIRDVAKVLSDTKLDKVSTRDYDGTPEILANKIDKVLRHYRFRGDREKMRDAILEVLYGAKTLSEACRGNNLAPTTLSTYVRLVKALINTHQVDAETANPNSALLLSNPEKPIKEENCLISLSMKSDLQNETYSGESAQMMSVRGVPIAILPLLDQAEPSKVESEDNFGIFPIKDGHMVETIAENVTKEPNSLVTTNIAMVEASANLDKEQPLQNINVMMLHTKLVMSNTERFYKLLITYLIEQQYRRSEEAQEKMRASLECVLLDGLSVVEALKVHKGPTEHVLQVYLNRCREANKCIRTGFANFRASVAQAINRYHGTVPKDATSPTVQAQKAVAATVKNNVKRSSRRLQKKEDNETPVDDAGTLRQLNMVFVEDLQKPMYDYLKKLDGVNFPIEDCLVVGLAKTIVEEFPVEQRLSFPDSVWNQWVANYRKEHPEFED